jgi:hypothetical protein
VQSLVQAEANTGHAVKRCDFSTATVCIPSLFPSPLSVVALVLFFKFDLAELAGCCGYIGVHGLHSSNRHSFWQVLGKFEAVARGR